MADQEEEHHMADQAAILGEEHHTAEEVAVLEEAHHIIAAEEGHRIAVEVALHTATIAEEVHHIIAAEATLDTTAAFLVAYRAVTS